MLDILAQTTVIDLVRIGGYPAVIAALVVAVVWLAKELRSDARLRIEAAERYAKELQTVQSGHAQMLAELRNIHTSDLKVIQEANIKELSRVHEARVEEMQQVTRAADAITELTQLLRTHLEPVSGVFLPKGKK